MAYPEIPAPAYAYLAKLDPKRFLPGVDQIPSDAITLVETNPRFVEAFMVGLNHEFARELLWREYPTDRRGSYFRHFWRWLDGQPDITPIHEWKPAAALGHTTRGGPGGQIVLLVRGQLLRRYPNTVVYAWREENGKLKDPPGPGDIHRPVFAGQFDPDITFFGFDLVETDLPQLFMVLQEQPTEPRFAFDEPNGQPAAAPAAWSDASWGHVAVNEGAHLKIEGNPLSGVARGPATFVTNAAHLAHITLQKPMRVAVHAKRLVEQP
jgi:hypothetical protein